MQAWRAIWLFLAFGTGPSRRADEAAAKRADAPHVVVDVLHFGHVFGQVAQFHVATSRDDACRY